MIEFIYPYLGLLSVLPFFVKKHMNADLTRKKQDDAIKTPLFDDIKNISEGRKYTEILREDKIVYVSNRFFNILAFIAWILLVIAVMRPVLLGEKIPLEKEGRNLMLAIDISGSMEEKDLGGMFSKSTRLAVARNLSKEFVGKRKGDRVGVVLFGTTAHLFIPLTYDIKTALEMLEEVDFGLVEGKTAIGDAIGVSLKSFKNIKSESSVLILLSDGTTNAGTLSNDEATALAKKMGVKIYTVGIGADQVKVSTIFGLKIANPSANMDEEALKKIAKETGGVYFRAKNIDEFKNIYKEIDQIEKIDNEETYLQPKKELFYYPLLASFILFSIILLFRARKS